MKIILNKSFGYFEISEQGYRLYSKKKNMEIFIYGLPHYSNEYIKLRNGDNMSYVKKIYSLKDYGELINIFKENVETFLLDKELRCDETLIEVIEELGDLASGEYSDLRVVEIPDGFNHIIYDYSGMETLYYSKEDIKNV